LRERERERERESERERERERKGEIEREREREKGREREGEGEASNSGEDDASRNKTQSLIGRVIFVNTYAAAAAICVIGNIRHFCPHSFSLPPKMTDAACKKYAFCHFVCRRQQQQHEGGGYAQYEAIQG
jgi:hypothetical protein